MKMKSNGDDARSASAPGMRSDDAALRAELEMKSDADAALHEKAEPDSNGERGGAGVQQNSVPPAHDDSRQGKAPSPAKKTFKEQFNELFLSPEFGRYMVSGLIATVVNLVVFTLMNRWIGTGKWYYSNLPAIILSVLVAFVLNRYWVFRSKGDAKQELWRFVVLRMIVSFVSEYAIYPLIYNVIGFKWELLRGLPFAKLGASLFVAVSNRVTGKFLVFTEKPRD